METLLVKNQIKTMIEVSSNLQDTIGLAAYGSAKFEKRILIKINNNLNFI